MSFASLHLFIYLFIYLFLPLCFYLRSFCAWQEVQINCKNSVLAGHARVLTEKKGQGFYFAGEV
jgi:hypothetical protein